MHRLSRLNFRQLLSLNRSVEPLHPHDSVDPVSSYCEQPDTSLLYPTHTAHALFSPQHDRHIAKPELGLEERVEKAQNLSDLIQIARHSSEKFEVSFGVVDKEISGEQLAGIFDTATDYMYISERTEMAIIKFPEPFRTKFNEIIKKINQRIWTILGDKYNTSGVFYTYLNISRYVHEFNDRGLIALNENYDRAVKTNRKKFERCFDLNGIPVDHLDPQCIATLLNLFSRKKMKQRHPITLEDISTIDVILKNEQFKVLHAARFFDNPIKAAAVLASTNREYSERLVENIHYVCDEELSILLELIEGWDPSEEPQYNIKVVILAGSETWNHLLRNNIKVRFAGVAATKFLLDNLFSNDPDLDDFKNNLPYNNCPLAEALYEIRMRGNNDFTIPEIKALKSFADKGVISEPSSISTTYFLGTMKPEDCVINLKNKFRFLEQLRKIDFDGIDLFNGFSLRIVKGDHESIGGMRFMLKHKNAILAKLGFCISENSLDIVQIQGARNGNQESYEEFKKFSGGMNPLEWLAIVGTRILVKLGNGSVRFIDGSFIKCAYPHVPSAFLGIYLVQNDLDARHYLENMDVPRIPEIIRQSNDQSFIDELEKFLSLKDRIIQLYRNTTQQMGFRRKKNSMWAQWPNSKGVEEVGKPLLTNESKYNTTLAIKSVAEVTCAFSEKFDGIDPFSL
ncbi:MAG: hypothetical protein ABIE74_13130 [Pseudomonadota bacterium]